MDHDQYLEYTVALHEQTSQEHHELLIEDLDHRINECWSAEAVVLQVRYLRSSMLAGVPLAPKEGLKQNACAQNRRFAANWAIARPAGLDARRIYGDRLGLKTDCHMEVHLNNVLKMKSQASFDDALESLLVYLNSVRPGGQIRDDVFTALVG